MSDENRIIRYTGHKMLEFGWDAFTPDSYFSEMRNLDDDEIKKIINMSDEDFDELVYKYDHYQKEN